MKTGIRISLTKVLSLLAFVLLAHISYSQPDYTFRNPSRISGTDKQVGAVYRFPSVKTNVDALVRIKAISNATLESIDRTADGFAEAFQPEVRVNGRRNGYIDFQITFVRSGTTTDTVRQSDLRASALDIDGNTSGTNVLYEYNEIDMGGGLAIFNTLSTQLSVTMVGSAFRATNVTGTLFGAEVDTISLDIMYTVRNANVGSFSWRTGVNNSLSNNQATRYMSLYFKAFNYPQNSVLSTPKVLDFKGNSDGNDATLTWKLDVPAEELSGRKFTCELQRAGENNEFVTIQAFTNLNSINYSYRGELLSSGKTLYRLKMIADNGAEKYSNVLSFYKGNKATRELHVYPTVVSANQFTINIPAERKQQGAIQIVNYAGQVVYEKQVELNAGSNSISIRDFSPALQGHHIVVARTGNEQFKGKIIIQNNSNLPIGIGMIK